jgi:adenosylcobinamide-GDP ribazoletransferase
MKDSSLGVFGAVAVILILLCKWLAFARLITADSVIWAILIFMVSRTMQVNLAVRLPYARSEGGTAISFVQNARGLQRVIALSLSLIVALAYGPIGLFLLALAETLTWLYGNWCRRHLGGITGDLLGAGNEIIEVVLLLLVASPASKIMAYTGWSWVFQ